MLDKILRHSCKHQQGGIGGVARRYVWRRQYADAALRVLRDQSYGTGV